MHWSWQRLRTRQDGANVVSAKQPCLAMLAAPPPLPSLCLSFLSLNFGFFDSSQQRDEEKSRLELCSVRIKGAWPYLTFVTTTDKTDR